MELSTTENIDLSKIDELIDFYYDKIGRKPEVLYLPHKSFDELVNSILDDYYLSSVLGVSKPTNFFYYKDLKIVRSR